MRLSSSQTWWKNILRSSQYRQFEGSPATELYWRANAGLCKHFTYFATLPRLAVKKGSNSDFGDVLNDSTHDARVKPESHNPLVIEESAGASKNVNGVSNAQVSFGSRLAGPAERRRELDKASRTVAGIAVPPRPEEPDNCCMSGCVNCVWDRYQDELEEWASKNAQAREARQMPQAQAVPNLSVGQSYTAMSMDDDGGGTESQWNDNLEQNSSTADLFEGIPVGIREFMKTEKRLRQGKKKSTIE